MILFFHSFHVLSIGLFMMKKNIISPWGLMEWTTSHVLFKNLYFDPFSMINISYQFVFTKLRSSSDQQRKHSFMMHVFTIQWEIIFETIATFD